MNRFAAVGLMLDALAGKQIIILTRTQREVREALDIVAGITPDTARVSRLNGAERIDFPSTGKLIFKSSRSTVRGYTADVVFLDDGAEPHDFGTLQDLRLVTRSRQGEIIRA